MTEKLTDEALAERLRKRADQIGKLLTDPPKDAPDAVLMREAADALSRRATPADDLRAENERLRKMLRPEWFYPADGYDGEQCLFSVHEVLDEYYFYDRQLSGEHVVEINVATSLPSIWAAVRFSCDCPNKDDCECDNDMIVTEHESKEAAEAALAQKDRPMTAPDKLCAGCGEPTDGMCWTDCGMSLCGDALCENCTHVDEKYGWRHEPRALIAKHRKGRA